MISLVYIYTGQTKQTDNTGQNKTQTNKQTRKKPASIRINSRSGILKRSLPPPPLSHTVFTPPVEIQMLRKKSIIIPTLPSRVECVRLTSSFTLSLAGSFCDQSREKWV